MLVSENAKICVSPDAKHRICVSPNAKPQHQPVEYRLRWVPGVGHVHFIFFVLISFALGSRRKRSFQWNMGLRVGERADGRTGVDGGGCKEV